MDLDDGTAEPLTYNNNFADAQECYYNHNFFKFTETNPYLIEESKTIKSDDGSSSLIDYGNSELSSDQNELQIYDDTSFTPVEIKTKYHMFSSSGMIQLEFVYTQPRPNEYNNFTMKFTK